MSVAKESRNRHGKGLFLSWMYDRRFPVISKIIINEGGLTGGGHTIFDEF